MQKFAIFLFILFFSLFYVYSNEILKLEFRLLTEIDVGEKDNELGFISDGPYQAKSTFLGFGGTNHAYMVDDVTKKLKTYDERMNLIKVYDYQNNQDFLMSLNSCLIFQEKEIVSQSTKCIMRKDIATSKMIYKICDNISESAKNGKYWDYQNYLAFYTNDGLPAVLDEKGFFLPPPKITELVGEMRNESSFKNDPALWTALTEWLQEKKTYAQGR
jgi:hypothetical protein